MPSVLNIATKAAALMATGCVAYEANALGVRQSKIKREKNYTDDFIANQIGSSKLNYPSAKHSAFKNWLANFKYPYKISELYNTVTGYIQGALKGVGYNIMTLGFAALTFFAKGSGVKKAGAIGLGLSVAWDFLKNSTNVFERTDYLRK